MLYRYQMFDLDFPLAVLAIVAFYPFSIKNALTGGKEVTQAATLLGFTLAAYCAGTYFLAGLSKLQISHWWSHVRLDLIYQAMEVWHGIKLPEWLDFFALKINKFLSHHHLAAQFLAITCLIAELGWFLSLFFKWTRWFFPILMIGAHAGIFLSSGILFFSMGAIAFLSILPCRKIFLCKNQQITAPNEAYLYSSTRMILGIKYAFLISSVIALLVCPIYCNIIYPFANYFQFGFNYEGIEKSVKVFRLGFIPPNSNEVLPVPINYGGFSEHRHIPSGADIEGYMKAKSNEEKDKFSKRISYFSRALKGPDSNRWILGALSYPPHNFAKTDFYPLDSFQKLYLLEGDFHLENGVLKVSWINHGEFSPK